MAQRRVVGVDLPSITINVPEVSPVKVDISPAQELFARASAAQQETYEAEIKGLAAKGEEIQAQYAKAQRDYESGASGVAKIVQGLQAGLETFATLEQQRQEQKAAQRQAQQEANKADLFRTVQSSLTKAQEYITTTADKEGIYAIESRLFQAIDAADVDPKTKAEMYAYASTQLRDFQGRQLTAIQDESKKTTEAMVAAVESATKLEMVAYGSYIAKGGLSGEAASSVITDAVGFIDSKIQELPGDIPIHHVLNLRARLLDTLSVSVGENYDAQIALQSARTRQAEWEKRSYEIATQYANDPVTRNSLLRSLRSEVFGETEAKVTTDLEVYQEREQLLSTAQKITELTRPEVEELGFLQNGVIGALVYQDLRGQVPIESIKDKPGMSAIYEQAKNAREVIRSNLSRLETIERELTSLKTRESELSTRVNSLSQYAAMAQNWDSLSQEQKLELTQAMKDGLIPSDLQKIQAEYNGAQQQLQITQTEYQQALQRYNETRAILRPFGFDEGIANQPKRYQQILQDADERGALRSLIGVDEAEGTTPNFPTRSGGNAPPPAPLPTVGQSWKEQNFIGMPAPFQGVRSEDVIITSTARDSGSHRFGHAIDFAVAGAGNNQVNVAPLVSGRVTEVKTGLPHTHSVGGGYGNFVAIEDAQGREWLYAHLGDVFVKVGDVVAQGQPIGKMADSGDSRGTHVHVQVMGADGQHVPYQQWYSSVKPEVDARNTTRGVGLPPQYSQASGENFRQAIDNLPPPEAIRLPSGAYIYNGQFYRSENDPVIQQALRNRGRSSGEVFSLVNQMMRANASNQRSAYGENHVNNNYGYRFLAQQNGFRSKLNQVATELGVPGQWLADALARMTGGTFGRGMRGTRVGIAGFSAEDARRLGVNPAEIATMNHSQQLDLLKRKLEPGKGKYETLEQFWLSLVYNPELVLSQRNLTAFLNNPAFRTGVEGLGDVGLEAGRVYNTIHSLLQPQVRESNPGTGGGGSVTNEPIGRRVASPNLKPEEAAFLDGIAMAEGTYADDGYFTNVGYTNRTQGWQPFRPSSGSYGTSDASGRYQFMSFTWNEYGRGLDINNPMHQDQVALRLIREKRRAGAIFDAVRTGDFNTFRDLVNGSLGLEWVGLTTKVNYPGQSGSIPVENLWRFVRERYRAYGGR